MRRTSLYRRGASKAHASGELAEPGTCGHLELRAVHEGEPLEHSGAYVYVGMVRGLHAFAPNCGEPVLYLQRSHVLSFEEDDGDE